MSQDLTVPSRGVDEPADVALSRRPLDPATPAHGTTSESATGRRGRGRRVAIASLLLVLAAGLVDTALVVLDLRTAEAAATDALGAVRTADLAAATAAANDASAAAQRAARRTARPHWTAATSLPAIGPSITAIRDASQAGAAIAVLADGALAAGAPLLDDRSALIAEQRFKVETLGAVADQLERLDPSTATITLDRLATSAAHPSVPEALHERAVHLGGLGATFVATLERAQVTLPVVYDLLGGSGPRRYLVAVQNPAELRGTGGLIGFLAVLEADAGAIQLLEPQVEADDALVAGTDLLTISRLSRSSSFDVTAPAEYVERYGDRGAAFLPSTNIDPDLPTVAALVLEQYRLASGDRLDGLIAIDPLGLQLIQRAQGPLDVPADVANLHRALPDPIPADDLAQLLLADSYELLGGGSPERRRYHAEVAGAALGSLLRGDAPLLELAGGVRDAVATRHLQVHSVHVSEQAVLDELHATGRFAPRDPGDDLLAVTAVNAAANKADVHVAHRLHHDISLQEQDGAWSRTARSGLTVTNAVDPEADRYISDSLVSQSVTEPARSTGIRGLVRTWVTVWTPEAASLVAVTADDGAPRHASSGSMHGRRALDHVLDTPSGETTGIEVVSDAPVIVTSDGDRVVYALTVWRQAKGVADDLELQVAPPHGWEIVGVELDHTEVAVGLGPAPYRHAPRVTSSGPEGVLVHGSLTADLRLEVVLQPAR